MTFDAQTKLSKLRSHLDSFNLDAYFVPTSDAHDSEYPVAADARREYISGFTGSAGTALVEKTEARLWTDGRYFLQAEQQLPKATWTLMKAGTPDCPTIGDYLKKSNLKRVGFDPYVHTLRWLEDLRKKLEDSEVTLVPIHKGSGSQAPESESLTVMKGIEEGQDNLVDRVWTEDGTRPAYPTTPIVAMSAEVAGECLKSKLERIRAKMAEKDAGLLIIASLDDIAWTFNLRGLDSAFSRVFLSYALVGTDFATLYIKEAAAPDRVSAEIRQSLSDFGVSIEPYENVSGDLSQKIQSLPKNQTVWIDSAVNTALTILARSLSSAKPVEEDIPVKVFKATKNDTEIAGMVEAHLQDGAALVLYLAWLDSLKASDLAKLTEVTAAQKLEKYRRAQPSFVTLSFESISAMDSNGAVIHYRPEAETAKFMNPNGMYLIDSGAHYIGGTTDVTRTVHFGIPSDWEKELYTRVLMGHVNLASFVWPQKIFGCQLDVLARQPLWEIGMDYLHGTGHGVGHSLEVHEAPPNISGRCPPISGDVVLEPGMVVSDEPGAYVDGKFGIRIENLLYVKKMHTAHAFNDATYLGFEHLTRVPYCRKLIKTELLSSAQTDYINEYHSHVYTVLEAYLKDPKVKVSEHDREVALEWLQNACEEIY